jgi:hypothetical protein
MLRKSVLDSVKVNNVSSKYFPYHDFNKLVTSPMFTNGSSVVIEPFDSNAIVQSVIDSAGYYVGSGNSEINMRLLITTRVGQTFIGNGKKLSSAQFNLLRVGTHDPEMTGNCYVKLYPMSEGTSGVDGHPANLDAPIAISEPIKVWDEINPKTCLQTTARWETFYFKNPPLLITGVPYCIVFTFSGGDATLGWVNISTSTSFLDPTGNEVEYNSSTGWDHRAHPYSVLFKIEGIVGSDSGVPDSLRHKFFVGGTTFINDSTQINGSLTLQNSNRLTGDTNQVIFNKGVKVTDSLTIHGYTGGTVGSALQGFKQSLKLGGVYNQTYNTGNSSLLHISDYSNDGGDNVYPIYVEDENNNVAFYLNGGALGGVGTAYIGGALTLGSTINGYTLRKGSAWSDTSYVPRLNLENSFTRKQRVDSIARTTVNGLPLVINAPLKVDSAITYPISIRKLGCKQVQRYYILPNNWKTLLEVTSGSGVATGISVALTKKVGGGVGDVRNSKIRISYDGAATPQIGGTTGIPIETFYGNTWKSQSYIFFSERLSVSTNDTNNYGANCRMLIPFSSGIKVEIFAPTDVLDSMKTYGMLEYNTHTSIVDNAININDWRLKCSYVQPTAVAGLDTIELLDYTGESLLLGTLNNITFTTSTWAMEGDHNIFYDGGASLFRSDGDESFFGSSFAYNVADSTNLPTYYLKNYGLIYLTLCVGGHQSNYRFFEFSEAPYSKTSMRLTWTNGDADAVDPNITTFESLTFYYVPK